MGQRTLQVLFVCMAFVTIVMLCCAPEVAIECARSPALQR